MSIYELTTDDRKRIENAARIHDTGDWNHMQHAFRVGAVYATKYERARNAQLEAMAAKLTADLREASDKIANLSALMDALH